jgi:hypothetical protein
MVIVDDNLLVLLIGFGVIGYLFTASCFVVLVIRITRQLKRAFTVRLFKWLEKNFKPKKNYELIINHGYFKGDVIFGKEFVESQVSNSTFEKTVTVNNVKTSMSMYDCSFSTPIEED